MKNLDKSLMIDQLDKKLPKFAAIGNNLTPEIGRIKSIRLALNISYSFNYTRFFIKFGPINSFLNE